MTRGTSALVRIWAFPLFLGVWFMGGILAQTPAPTRLEGLRDEVRVIRDSEGIPHIFAKNDHDAFFILGYVHSQDRFFQMDTLRRLFSGTLAELLGPAALPSDIQFRNFGLRRAAAESLKALSPQAAADVKAYAGGVNAYLQSGTLPPEYGALEITNAQQWSPIDSAAIGKGLAFGLSFDLSDINRSLALLAFQAVGSAAGFDGGALFFEDLFRTAPFDPAVSIAPGVRSNANGAISMDKLRESAQSLSKYFKPKASKLAAEYIKRIREIPNLRRFTEINQGDRGSNWWLISGTRTNSRYPMLANDPHLALNTPSTFYEAHMTVSNDPQRGPMNINGVTFAGIPSFPLGCNDRICWGATVNPMDVTDVYVEQLVIDPSTFLPLGTRFDNTVEPLGLSFQRFQVNQIGNDIADDLADANVGPLEGGLNLIVPRRNNGPIIAADFSDPTNITALSVAYTGWRATRELEAFLKMARARTVQEFAEALQNFDFGSQNWAVTDVDGNIAYFTSAELPIREDLQQGIVDGLPPYFLRDGTHTLKNEWLPVQNRQPGQALNFEILPFSEMPQVVNPPQGFIASANNDPVGTSLDNNPLNQLRPGGGIFYLSPGYTSLREGRITRLIEDRLSAGGKISIADMFRIQQNTQMLDAQIFTPHLITAFQDAQSSSAPPDLSSLAADPGVAEAVARLAQWDFSSPTGIQQGYDAGDDPDIPPEPSGAEIDNSVAAAIYSVWRGQFIRNTIDSTLQKLGLEALAPDSERSLSAIRNLLDNFSAGQGVGASGLNFFAVNGMTDPTQARDFLILKSLKDALDLMAGKDFAAAFNFSTNQSDYRWGRLHRIVFDHLLGGPFNIPNAGGFADLSPELPGIPTDGGFQVVDASSHSARADSQNEFMFGSGPSRRFIGQMLPDRVLASQIIPGGESGVVVSPLYANQLGRWLTNHQHLLLLTEQQVLDARVSEQLFAPPAYVPFVPWRVP